MSAPRPYETDPFHPPSSVRVPYYDQFLYIYKTVPYISSMWYLVCLETLHIYNLRMHSFRTLNFKVQRHFGVILSSVWFELVQDAARHCYLTDSTQMHPIWRWPVNLAGQCAS